MTTHADIARELRRIARERDRELTGTEFARRCRQTASQIENLVGAHEDTATILRAGIKRNVEWFARLPVM